ncbi:hypothetical protein EDB89DRAFT_1907737 [Lactarius sanguifluus]|nr:hypothetical protein EDB89DRAFT_1907737 [Lactarius sanguifluus]
MMWTLAQQLGLKTSLLFLHPQALEKAGGDDRDQEAHVHKLEMYKLQWKHQLNHWITKYRNEPYHPGAWCLNPVEWGGETEGTTLTSKMKNNQGFIRRTLWDHILINLTKILIEWATCPVVEVLAMLLASVGLRLRQRAYSEIQSYGPLTPKLEAHHYHDPDGASRGGNPTRSQLSLVWTAQLGSHLSYLPLTSGITYAKLSAHSTWMPNVNSLEFIKDPVKLCDILDMLESMESTDVKEDMEDQVLQKLVRINHLKEIKWSGQWSKQNIKGAMVNTESYFAMRHPTNTTILAIYVTTLVICFTGWNEEYLKK